MMAKLKAFVDWFLQSKVGNGFAFLLYSVLVFVFALVKGGTFIEVSAALFAGLGVQTGQRTYTQVTLTKANCAQQNGGAK